MNETPTPHRRRQSDLFANSGLGTGLAAHEPQAETWRELVSMGVTFGSALAGLAALVMFLG